MPVGVNYFLVMRAELCGDLACVADGDGDGASKAVNAVTWGRSRGDVRATTEQLN